MKLALLSDIHGNHHALRAVLNAVRQQHVDTLLIAGDFVGYYFWPVEVFSLLKEWDIVAIRGNHDRMLEDIVNDKSLRLKLYEKYGSGLDVAFEQLDSKSIEWLTHLPDSIEYETKDGNVLLCHGSPWDRDEYIYPDSSDLSLKRYENLNVKWVIQGHTHYPMYLKIGNIVLINPGSVGQPRNSQPGAHWATLDTDSGIVKHFCEKYDLSIVVKESQKRHPEIPYLAKILDRK